ncbi:MAG: hypothetical protein MJ175_03810 [Clostridia bacterium]|nr:hypothetical protein [Clostridia bacterium]
MVIPKGKNISYTFLVKQIRFLIIIFLCVLVLLTPEISAEGVRSGLALCVRSVVPALFPFMILIPLISQSLYDVLLFQSGKHSVILPCFLLGMISGFPIGALNVIENYESGQLDKSCAERALGVCNATGPAFLIGFAGLTIFHSSRLGWCFVLVQIVSAGLTAMLFLRPARSSDKSAVWGQQHNTKMTFAASLQSAVSKIMIVCGFVVIFSVARFYLSELFSLPCFSGLSGIIPAMIGGMMELTGGLADLGQLLSSVPQTLLFPLAAFIISFGGICVYLQTAVFAQRAGLSMKYYLPEKLVCGMISFVLASLLSVFIS